MINLLNSVLPPGAIRLNSVGQYDGVIIAASYLLAVTGSYIAISIVRTLRIIKGKTRHIGIFFGAVAMGTGIWSMHYTGMLASNVDMEHHYNLGLTIISGLAAIGFSAVAFYIVSRELFDYRHVLFGAPILGLGVVVMHYTGMASMEMQATTYYVRSLFILSIAIAIGASAAALWIMHYVARESHHPLILQSIAALVMGFAICGMHYTGMAATIFVPFADCRFIQVEALQSLALLITLSALLVMLMAYGFNIYLKRLLEDWSTQTEFFFLSKLQIASIVLTITIVGTTAYLAFGIHSRIHSTYVAETKEDEVSLPISNLDEVLTMSAQMAASTGDLKWEERYHTFGPQIDAALKKAMSYFPDPSMQAVLKRIEAANDDLVAMELQSFQLVHQGHRTQAMQMLNSQRYKDSKALYAEAFKNFSAIIHTKDEESFLSTSFATRCMLFMLLPSIAVLIVNLLTLIQGKKILSHAIHERNFGIQLINAIPDPIFVKDAQHTWRIGNDAFRQMMGGKAEGYINRTDCDIFSPELVAELWEDDDIVLKGGKAVTNEEVINLAGHESITAVTTKVPLTLMDGSPGLVGIIHDISTLKKTEQELAAHRDNLQSMVNSQTASIRREAARQALMRSIVETANKSHSEFEAMEYCLNEICKAKEYAVGHCYLFNNTTQELESSHIWTHGAQEHFQIFVEETERLHVKTGVDMPGNVLEEKKAVWIENIQESDFFLRKLASKAVGFNSAIGLPIMIGREAIGIFEFFHKDVVTVDTQRLELMDSIGVQIGQVVERFRQSTMLETAKKSAEIANEAKSDFLANMSHELRTPLNSIVGMAQLMNESTLQDDQVEMIETIISSSENLLDIVNDILDLSKIESASIELETVPFNPYACTQRIISMLSSSASRRGLTLSFHANANPEEAVIGDPVRYMRIVTNLVSNAIKYTEVGNVDVYFSTIPQPDDTLTLRLDVVDTGIGIATDKLGRVFEKFMQADSSTTRKYGGSGLGLAITKQLVEMMNGHIDLESVLDKGSKFSVSLNFKKTTQLAVPVASDASNYCGILSPAKARVLVAEDHELNKIYLRRLLPSLGIENFTIVENGKEAVEAVATGNFDIVLMDCHMPVLNGYEATAAIRAAEKYADQSIAIIAMTANAMMGEREKCLSCGMDEYISKPISKPKLVEILSRWLNLHTIPTKPESVQTSHSPLDMTVLHSFSSGDRDLERDLAASFVKQSREHLDLLDKYCIDGISIEWKESAHLLKGGAAMMGAKRMQQLCGSAQEMINATKQSRHEMLHAIRDEFNAVITELKTKDFVN